MDYPEGRKPINNESGGSPIYRSAFLMEHKEAYIKKPKNYENQDEDICVICKIIRKDNDIDRLVLFRDKNIIIYLNVYPYTTGHLLISPIRHTTSYDELTKKELEALSFSTQRALKMLKHYNGTDSFNCGWNQGIWAGGSIAHFHIHIVPRYKTDANFVDIIARSRAVLKSLENVEKDLLKYQRFLSGEKTLEELFL